MQNDARVIRLPALDLLRGLAAPNAEVDYVDADTRKVLATEKFHDPGLVKNGWLEKEERARGVWKGWHLAYCCGRPL